MDDYGDRTPPWYYHTHAVIQARRATKSELVFVNDHLQETEVLGLEI